MGEFINKDQLCENMRGTVNSWKKSEIGEFINKEQLWEHMGGTESSVTKSEIGVVYQQGPTLGTYGRNCK